MKSHIWGLEAQSLLQINEFPNSEIVLIGAGDEEGNAHAPNESVNLIDIQRLIDSLSDALSSY